MLSNQQLYLVNHYALVARRHGVQLPDLKLLLGDLELLRQQVERGLMPGVEAAVAEAASKVAASMQWRLTPGSQAKAKGMTTEEFQRAQAALVAVAGPIASFIVEQIDTTASPMSLERFLDEAATLAELDAKHRRALRQACGFSPD